jgi:hypothetical protein
MERRIFLKLAFGVAAGAAVMSAGAQAAPLSPQPIEGPAVSPRSNADAQPAVITADEAARLAPEQVRWGWHHRHWGWRRRHWGWHHRHWGWRHRHWGWRHRWHRHHWRYW